MHHGFTRYVCWSWKWCSKTWYIGDMWKLQGCLCSLVRCAMKWGVLWNVWAHSWHGDARHVLWSKRCFERFATWVTCVSFGYALWNYTRHERIERIVGIRNLFFHMLVDCLFFINVRVTGITWKYYEHACSVSVQFCEGYDWWRVVMTISPCVWLMCCLKSDGWQVLSHRAQVNGILWQLVEVEIWDVLVLLCALLVSIVFYN